MVLNNIQFLLALSADAALFHKFAQRENYMRTRPETVLWGRPSLLLQTRPPRTLACHHSIPCLPGSFFRTWPKNDHDLAIALSVQLLFNIIRSLAPAPKGKCSSGGMAKTQQKTNVISLCFKSLTP